MSATIGTPPPTQALNLNNGVLSASAPLLNLSQTWNNAGATFTAVLLNVAGTAFQFESLLADFRVGGVTKFCVRSDGYAFGHVFNATSWAAGGFLWAKGDTEGVYFGSAQDTSIRRTATGAVELNGGAGTLRSKLRLETDAPPATATDPGTTGQIRYDADYIYVCTATDTWVRSPLSTW
jgi:hypothetical protein